MGFGVTLLYGNDFPAFLAGLGPAPLDLAPGRGWGWPRWTGSAADFGSGSWPATCIPKPSLKGMILAGGMGAWAGYITPLNSGAGPMTMYTMRRYGVPLPVAVTSTFMSFVATILFFAIAGPLALLFGAGRSLGQRGNVLGLSLYDLFLGSLTIIAGIGVLMAVVIFFPRFVRDLIHRVGGVDRPAEPAGRRPAGAAAGGHRRRPTRAWSPSTARADWLALFWATILSAPSHANKLLAGYVALRALGLHANFVDILLVQTLVMFLLYFAPTPGASGIGEVLSAAVMSLLRAAGAHADLHPDLAAHPHLLHARRSGSSSSPAGCARGSRASDQSVLAEPAG